MKYLVIAGIILIKGVSIAVGAAVALAMALWAGSSLQTATQPYNAPQDVQLVGSVQQATPSTLQVGQNVQP